MINIVRKIRPHKIYFCIKIPKCTNLKEIHTSNLMNSSQNTKYLTVYKFNYIRSFSVINRLKLYQTILAGLSIPSSLVLNQLNFISFDIFQVICVLGLSGCLTFHGLGFFTAKFIGFIYYNEQKSLVKIAYVDFWGRRKDIEIPSNDVMPINELPYSATDILFLKFRRYSTKDILKLNLKYGVIIEKDLIKKIL